MDRLLFGTYSFQDVLMMAAVIAGCLILISLLRKLFGKPGENKHTQPVQCPGCGWHGRVSRYAGQCPRCNQPLGERKARTRS
ncbi:hypothetical protein ACFL0Q_01630 [Thermodesulfobacteriota bacterium]